jgi:hypothetical protein
VALVRTDVSEELSTSFIRVKRIGELGTTPAYQTFKKYVLAVFLSVQFNSNSSQLSWTCLQAYSRAMIKKPLLLSGIHK